MEEELPVRVQEALGELAAAAREGLLALSVGVGLGVLAELMEEEVVGVVGAKGKHDRERVAVRHGHGAGAVTLGGRRVAVERPRIRSADGGSELSLATYRHFSDRDPLTRVVFERMLAGVSTRRYRRIQELVGREVEQRARSISKSKRTLTSTNPCESMIECVRRTSRNVKRWQSGEMALRWTAAGMLEAERQFRRVIGYRDLAKLAFAIERDLAHTTPVACRAEEAGAARRRAPVVPFTPVTWEEVIEAV